MNFKYYDRNKNGGYFTSKVGRKFWDTLITKLDDIKYKTDLVNDDSNIADAEYYSLVIYWTEGKIQVTKLKSRNNNLVNQTLMWLDSSYRYVKLQRAEGPIKFETTPTPLLPHVDSVNFPPPILKKRKSK